MDQRNYMLAAPAPIVLDTPCNESEPGFRRPQDAIGCFLRTGMHAPLFGEPVAARAA